MLRHAVSREEEGEAIGVVVGDACILTAPARRKRRRRRSWEGKNAKVCIPGKGKGESISSSEEEEEEMGQNVREKRKMLLPADLLSQS